MQYQSTVLGRNSIFISKSVTSKQKSANVNKESLCDRKLLCVRRKHDDDEEDRDEEAHPPTGEQSETNGKENKKDRDPSESPEK